MSENDFAAGPQVNEARRQCFENEAKPRAFWRKGRGFRRIVALSVLILVAWRLHADRGYWQSAWKQRTPWPKSSAGRRENYDEFHAAARAQFDLSGTLVPESEILSGGPAKDGIPALTRPMLMHAEEASYLHATDRVIGFVHGNEARAYPLRILDYHEIVNDHVGDLSVAVTYCPLCDSCAVFDRRTELGQREFGVSGLLYNGNMLMYDRGGQTESLWSQVMTKGTSGPAAGKRLTALPLELTTWEDWRSRHPETMVLTTDTGHQRQYSRSPYGDYLDTPDVVYPAKPTNDQLTAKVRVLGVWTGTVARAYPESAFRQERLRIEDALAGKKIVIEFNLKANSFRVVEADDGVSWMYSLWFAWYAMRPQTDVFGP